MILMMLATPLAMVACNYPVSDAATVIQWHVLGMFLPSFFTGRLIDAFGAAAIALTGAVTLGVSAAVAASGIAFLNFGIALALLGVGWNFMYTAGTTMITASHRPEERGRVQGAADDDRGASPPSRVVRFGRPSARDRLGSRQHRAAPMLLTAAVLTLWYARRVSGGQFEAVR